MLGKKKLGNFSIICNFFCKCLHFKLFCKVGFGFLIYLTYIWFFFPILKLHFYIELKMVKSFENQNVINENTCEAFMNDVMEEYEINPNLQTKISQNLQNEKKK